MVLEFHPYFQPDRNKDRESLAGLNQTISGIGQDWQQYGQQSKENKIRQAYLDLAKQRQAKEEADSGPLYSGFDATPQGTSSWNPSPLDMGRQPWAQSPNYGGGSPSGAPSPSSNMAQGTMGPQPQAPQYADAGAPDTGFPQQNSSPGQQRPQPGQPWHAPGTDLSSHVMAHIAAGSPPTYNHPEMGGVGQSGGGQNPMQGMDWHQFSRMNKNQREGYSIFNKDQLAHDLQQSEIEKNRAMASMYGNKGIGSGSEVTWHLDPFTQTYVPLPKKMPGGGSSMTPPSNRNSGEIPGATPDGGLDAKTKWKRNAELPKARGSATNTLQQYDTMIRNAEDILKDPGLNYATGATSFTNKIPGSPMKNVSAKLDTLKAKTLLNVLGSMKELSSNGASGFGALSEVEGENIRNSVASLDMKQGTEAFKNNLQQFIDDMKNKRSTIGSTFKSTYGEDLPGSGNTQGQQGNTGGIPEMKVINGQRYEKHDGQWFAQ